MIRRLSIVVILALAAALSFAGCAVISPDTIPMPRAQETDVTRSGGESAQPEPEIVHETDAAPAIPPSSTASAIQMVTASPLTEAQLPSPTHSLQAFENRIIPTRVPILYYHSISDQPIGIRELSVTLKDFEAQMRHLAENGYTAITFAELDHFTLFEKPVIITFDDGYADNYTNAYPIVKKYELRATIFMISGLIDTAGYLTRDEMAEMTDVISFQGHTVHHENLTKLSPDLLETALTAPKETISTITNAPVYVFAYPTGYYNDDVVSAVSAHYAYAVSIKWGYYEKDSDKLLIRRLYVHRDRTLEEFIYALG